MFELPRTNAELTLSALKSFVRRKTRETGARALVLGLSGGLDSAFTAHLLVQSEPGAPVRVFWLPYRTSDPRSERDARAVAESLGLELGVMPVTGVVDAARADWGVEERVRVGNLAARARMMALFDASARLGGVVVGTSNLSERYLGYGTLHGDMAAAFNPIGNLFKTQVRELAPHLGVPEEIIFKTPTADLWEDQTDERELGFSYEDADRVLFMYGRMGLAEEEIIAAGLPAGLVRAVLERVRKFEFKGRPVAQGPPAV